MTLDQVYDELYGEIDQIKNELKNTLAQIQYASNFTEGISLGTLSVGAESSQVITPHVALLPGAESGMMLLDLPVGTESAMLPALIQDDPEATELVPDAIPTGETMESVLNSKIGYTLLKTVDTDGVKTASACLDELFTTLNGLLSTISLKELDNLELHYDIPDVAYIVYHFQRAELNTVGFVFTTNQGSSTMEVVERFRILTSGSIYTIARLTAVQTEIVNGSDTVLGTGRHFHLYYRGQLPS